MSRSEIGLQSTSQVNQRYVKIQVIHVAFFYHALLLYRIYIHHPSSSFPITPPHTTACRYANTILPIHCQCLTCMIVDQVLRVIAFHFCTCSVINRIEMAGGTKTKSGWMGDYAFLDAAS